RAGFGSLEPAEAMEALEVLLSRPLNQCALMKTTRVQAIGNLHPAKGKQGATLTDQMVKDHVQSILRESVAEVSNVQEWFIQEERNFSEYGVDSIVAIKLINVINKKCQLTLRTTALFDNNNIKQLLHYILREHMTTLRASLQEHGINGNSEVIRLPKNLYPKE